MGISRGEDLALAHRLADAADAITLSRYQAIDLAVTTKPDNTPVTDADKSAEDAIRALLHAHRPDDGIVGEEFGNVGLEKNTYAATPQRQCTYIAALVSCKKLA